jgi:opacity protein-like surface antigen
MKPFFLFLLLSAPAFSQPFGFGIKGGVPMTDFLSATSQSGSTLSYLASTDRYVVGPMAELRLPFSLGVEVNALYRHYGFSTTGAIVSSTTTGAWEFPLVAKYRFKAPLVHPYVAAGVAWDKLSGLTQTIASAAPILNTNQLHKDVIHGFVFGGGVEVKVLLIRVAPEIRFTRWNDQHFLDPAGLLKSNLNQAEFLVGITF